MTGRCRAWRTLPVEYGQRSDLGLRAKRAVSAIRWSISLAVVHASARTVVSHFSADFEIAVCVTQFWVIIPHTRSSVATRFVSVSSSVVFRKPWDAVGRKPPVQCRLAMGAPSRCPHRSTSASATMTSSSTRFSPCCSCAETRTAPSRRTTGSPALRRRAGRHPLNAERRIPGMWRQPGSTAKAATRRAVVAAVRLVTNHGGRGSRLGSPCAHDRGNW